MTTNTVSISQDVCDSQIFDPFRDSMTEGYFSDAVVDHHGCTFNRPFIMQWLSEHHTCPYTGQHLQAYQLVANRAFQHAQDTLFNEENGSVVMLQRQVTVLTQENQELRAENKKLKVEKQALSDLVQGLSSKIDKLEEKMEKETSELRTENKNLTKEVQELRKNVENKSDNKVSVVTEKALKEIGSSSNSCIGSTSECIVATAKAFTYPVVFPVKKIVKLIF